MKDYKDNPDHLRKTKQFAQFLDNEDFDGAASFVASKCRYEMGDNVTVGRDKIIASYKQNDEWARSVFDVRSYESQVQKHEGGQYRITYTDKLQIRDQKHTYRCQQDVFFDEDNLINLIRHYEILGEREKLSQFEQLNGIKRPKKLTTRRN